MRRIEDNGSSDERCEGSAAFEEIQSIAQGGGESFIAFTRDVQNVFTIAQDRLSFDEFHVATVSVKRAQGHALGVMKAFRRIGRIAHRNTGLIAERENVARRAAGYRNAA